MALHILNRLQDNLALTPDQVAKIKPIIDSAASDIHSIHMETMQRVNKVFEDVHAQVAAILTPDQRTKLDQMDKERRDTLQAHWQENHHHPSPSPGASAQ
jgi:Spy/CpxP family protein refolding chaperone